jgi:UDP-glucose 4-epimerase
MKVLVSGASGFLGHHVVARLLERGHCVRAIVRPASPDPPWKGEVEIFRADLRVYDKLNTAFDGIDAVLHLAATTSGDEDVQFASTVVATERLLEAMSSSSVKRLVHVSSFVAYDWARAKRIMDEETPLLSDMYQMGGYTIAKIWQERLVSRAAAAHSWKLTIMRPGFIWGPQHAVIGGMGRIFGRICLMFGPFTRLPLTHVMNCANCLVAAIECPGSVGESFNVIDGDQIRVLRYVREYARRTGQRGILLPVPYRLGLAVAHFASFASRTLFGKKGQLPSLLIPRRFEQQFKPIRFSNRKLKDKLSWSPPLSFDKCLNLTYGPSSVRAHRGDSDP